MGIRMFDSNGDGYLSWPDVEKGIRVLGISQARALATGFSEVDGSRVLTDQEYDYMSKEERKWLERHSRVFLLHDFDFYQKWRCTYAWADKKMVPNNEEDSKMDWMGTGQLRGEISVEEILASQKEHFKQLTGVSEQFMRNYSIKRMERHKELEDEREQRMYFAIF